MALLTASLPRSLGACASGAAAFTSVVRTLAQMLVDEFGVKRLERDRRHKVR